MSVAPLPPHECWAGAGCEPAALESTGRNSSAWLCPACISPLWAVQTRRDAGLTLLPLTCSAICSLPSPIPYEELVCLIDEASEKNLSVSILTQVRGQRSRGPHSWVSALVS